VQIALGVVAVCGITAAVFALSSASNSCLYGNIVALVGLLLVFWLGYVVTYPNAKCACCFMQCRGNLLALAQLGVAHFGVSTLRPCCQGQTMSSNQALNTDAPKDGAPVS